MKKILFIFIFIGTTLFAQEIIIRPVSYSVNAIYSYPNGIKFTCDSQERMQDSLFFYLVRNNRDTTILFRSYLYNNCLHGTGRWYNEDGKLIQQTEVGPGGCTVHPGLHTFKMAGNLKMNLSALITTSTYWYESYPNVKRREDFYYEEFLDKRVMYYKNGNRKSEYHYKHDYPKWSYGNMIEWDALGPCKLYYENGQIEMEGDMDGSDKTGTWKYYRRNGDLYMENIYHKKDSSSVTMYYPTGEIEKTYTSYKHKQIGSEKTFYKSGAILSLTSFDESGNQKTPKITYYESGAMKESNPCCGTWNNGMYTRWHENGVKKEEVKIVDGYRTGSYTSWYSNGQIEWKGKYGEYSHEVGKWYYYKENGKLDHIEDFDKTDEEEIVDELVWSGDGLTTNEADEDEVWRLKPFEQTLPKISFLNEHIPVTKENGFSIHKKYPLIQVQININSNGNANYTILTPMKPKHKEPLEKFFNDFPSFDYPHIVMGKPVNSIVIIEIEYKEKK